MSAFAAPHPLFASLVWPDNLETDSNLQDAQTLNDGSCMNYCFSNLPKRLCN